MGALETLGLRYYVNFLSLPLNTRNSLTLGYCFVNLTEPRHAEALYKALQQPLTILNCEVQLDVVWSQTQGFRENVLFCRNPTNRTRQQKVLVIMGGQPIPLEQAKLMCAA